MDNGWEVLCFWSVAWGDSWGSSWGPLHQVDELRRSRTNFRLKPIREARVRLSGVSASSFVGEVRGRGFVPVRRVAPGRVRLSGVVASATAGTVSSRAAGVGRVTGVRIESAAGALAARAGARRNLVGVKANFKCGSVFATGGASATFVFDEGVETFVGELGGHGVKNLTDEQLVCLTFNLLTCK